MSKYKRIIIYILFTLVLISYPPFLFAEWQGPKEVIVGTWGTNSGQFYFDSQDTADLFPRNFAVDKEGNIIIRDEGNFRILIYNDDGKLKNIIKKPPELPATDSTFYWPTEFKLLSNNYIVIFCDYEKVSGGIRPLKQCFLDYNGKIIKKIETGELFPTDDGYILKMKGNYYAYTLSGNLLKTYTKRPLELGVVDEQSLSGGRYKVTIKYPDMTYTLNKGPYSDYIRICEAIYAISGKSAEKFNISGEVLGELIVPEDQRKVISPAGRGFEEVSKVIEEYGQPVVAPTGDIYTWERTPDKYSILKWVWIDGSDAPQSLKAASSKTGITLTWEVPREDADRVDEYEINRSIDVCGPFMPIGSIKKDVLTYEDQKVKAGETYYYQIRAIRDKAPSGYSNKAIGKK